MKRGFADTSHGQIHYLTEGSGEPLLMLHMTPTSSQEFALVIPILAKKYWGIAMDTLGYGDLVGLCGTSGRSGNIPHLHFEVFSKTKYDYSDAIPISFNNLKGKLDQRGTLIRNEKYEALKYEKKNLIKSSSVI